MMNGCRLAVAAAALLVLVGLGVAAYYVYDATPDDVPTWSLLVAVLLPAVLVGLYFKARFRTRVLYALADGLYTWLLPMLAAPFLWLGARTMLWLSPRFLDEGRIAKVAAADGFETRSS